MCTSALSGMWLHSGLLSQAPLLVAAFHAVQSFSPMYLLTIQMPVVFTHRLCKIKKYIIKAVDAVNGLLQFAYHGNGTC